MKLFSGKLPAPEPDPVDEPFWAALREGTLRLQQCGACARYTHPPLAMCPYCQSVDRHWRAAPRTGELYSFTIVHHAAHPGVSGDLPYNVAVVAFPECDGVRLISNVIGATDLSIGMALDYFLDPVEGGYVVPRFKPHVA